MSDALDRGLRSSRDDRERRQHYDHYSRREDRNHHRYERQHYHQNRYGGSRGNNYRGGQNYYDSRPPPPPPGGPGYDRALEAKRPRFGSTLGRGGGRGRGPRLPGNVKERTTQVFVSEQVMLSKEIITRLGDFRSDSNDPEQMISDMREMAEVLVSTNDLKTFRDDMSELYVKCMSQLSIQGPLVATLLALMSKANNEFPAYVVGKMSTIFNNSVSKGDILNAKLLLRAFSVLASAGALAISGEGGFATLVETLLVAAEGRVGTPSISFVQQVSTYLLASSAPWLAAIVVHRCGALAARCREVFRGVLSGWKSPFDTNGRNAIFNVNTIMLEDPTQGPEDMACWDTLWEACNVADALFAGEETGSDPVGATTADGVHVHSSSFEYSSCFLRPWTKITEDMSKPFVLAEVSVDDVVDNGATDGDDTAVANDPPVSSDVSVPVAEGGLLRLLPESVHAISEILCSADLEDTLRATCGTSTKSSWLCCKFPIFDAETGPQAATCVELSAFDKFFMADIFRDIFFLFQPYIRDDGAHIGTVEQIAIHLLATFKLFPEDSKVHLEYILIETLLLLLVQVPTVWGPAVTRLILDLCKKSAKIPPAVASVTGVLVQLFPAMDTSAWRGIALWLSSHLTNTKLAWPYWEHWGTEYASCESDSVHRAFMTDLVQHCERAVSSDRLRSALPASLHDAIHGEFSPELGDLFASTADTSEPLVGVAHALLQKIDTREDPDDLQEWLEDSHDGVDDALQVENWRVGFLVKAILISGSRKTFSQLITLIEKYRDVLRELGDGEEAQKVILESILSITGHDMGFSVILLDVIIRRGILKPICLAEYISEEETLSKLATDIYLHSLVDITVARSLDISQALISRRKMLVGKGLSMESDADTSTKDYSGAVTHVMAMGGGSSGEQSGKVVEEESNISNNDGNNTDIAGGKRSREDDEDDPDVDEADEDSSRRRRRKFDEDDKVPENGKEDSSDSAKRIISQAAAELAVVDATLTAALRDCRIIYSKLVTALIKGLSDRQKKLSIDVDDVEGDGNITALLDPWCMVALSLLRIVFRGFHSAQDVLLLHGDSEHKVCDVASVESNISDIEITPQLRAIWKDFSC